MPCVQTVSRDKLACFRSSNLILTYYTLPACTLIGSRGHETAHCAMTARVGLFQLLETRYYDALICIIRCDSCIHMNSMSVFEFRACHGHHVHSADEYRTVVQQYCLPQQSIIHATAVHMLTYMWTWPMGLLDSAAGSNVSHCIVSHCHMAPLRV